MSWVFPNVSEVLRDIMQAGFVNQRQEMEQLETEARQDLVCEEHRSRGDLRVMTQWDTIDVEWIAHEQQLDMFAAMLEELVAVEEQQRAAMERLQASERVRALVMAFEVGQQSQEEVELLKESVALVQVEQRLRLALIEEERAALEDTVDMFIWEALEGPTRVPVKSNVPGAQTGESPEYEVRRAPAFNRFKLALKTEGEELFRECVRSSPASPMAPSPRTNPNQPSPCSPLERKKAVPGPRRILDLSFQHLHDGQAWSVAHDILFAQQLTELDLRSNDFTSEGVEILAPAIGRTAGLEAIHLQWNPIGDEGALMLVSHILNLPTCTSLNLKGSGMTSTGKRAVQQMVKGSRLRIHT